MPDLLTRATGGSKGFLPCEIVTATTAHCYYCTWGEGLPRPATNTSPLTGLVIPSLVLTPETPLQRAIEEYLSGRPVRQACVDVM